MPSSQGSQPFRADPDDPVRIAPAGSHWDGRPAEHPSLAGWASVRVVGMANPSATGDLLGLRAAVLGSTSGIGRAVALELAAAGADLLIHGRRSRAAAEEVAAECRRRGSGRAEVLMADLADRAAGDRLVERSWSLWG